MTFTLIRHNAKKCKPELGKEVLTYNKQYNSYKIGKYDPSYRGDENPWVDAQEYMDIDVDYWFELPEMK